jgi:hypothetical protein
MEQPIVDWIADAHRRDGTLTITTKPAAFCAGTLYQDRSIE